MMPLKAYAKINLGLRILEKLSDGYHNIETVFHKINLFDEIEIFKSETVFLETTSKVLPTDDNNLCIKAVKLFQKNFNINEEVGIKLIKNIPIGAGLGGGSSDAATVLKNLPKFYNIEYDENELKNIAIQLGADVPYFLKNGSAYATGKGEILEYFNLSIPYWILTITPEINISTKWAYENVKIKNIHQNLNLKNMILNYINDIEFLKTHITNDFETIVFEKYPEIRKIKEDLYKYGADFVLLSGSGSSIFAFINEEKLAKFLAKKFQERYFISLTEPYFNV